MQIGSRIHGFAVTRVRELKEMEARLWELEHEKTGAQLLWLERADENKTFAIAFKTLPEDSTGVFHILEHSVLCGSDKYPVKEPFVELLKTSVQTFLNAFTYPDKTVYPVSSRNDQDFLNLMDVYLDAVLHPAIYHKPEIFRQEGWRYEQGEKGTVYQGVVFNEMKGAFSSAREVLENAMNRMLFPDNCYRFVSGGDPEHIPDLTYERFLETHRRFYHPSNARIALVGSVDLEAALEKIESFLQPYESTTRNFSIPMQTPVKAVTKTIPYEIGEDEEGPKAIISAGRLLGRFDERELLLAANILADYLAGDNDAPLKKAVVGAGLGQELSVDVADGLQQNILSWSVWNTEVEKLPQIRSTIRKTLERIAEEGLDPQRLRACYNALAFRLRDRDGGWAPRSLSEALTVLDTWLYDGDPAQALLAEELLQKLGEKLESDYFSRLLRKLFLEDEHWATAVLRPSKTLGKEKAEKEAARIARESAAWTEERKAQLLQEAESLKAWQQTPDSPETLASIPVLRLSDLAERPAPLPLTVTTREGVPVLCHGTGSRLLAFKTIFNAADLPLEELPKLVVLSMVLGTMGTKKRSGEELQMLVKERIGKRSFQPTILPGRDPGHCQVLFAASALCLGEEAELALDLMTEILTETDFSDRDLLRDLLQQSAMETQMALSSAGHQYALMRVSAYETAHGAAREYTAGTALAMWLKQWSTAADEELDGLLGDLSALAKRIFTAERLTVSCTENMPEALLEKLIDAFPKTGEPAPEQAAYAPLGAGRDGVVIPAQVGFAARGGNRRKSGKPYCGSIPVLSNVLNYVYLWNEIRVQGGAYGCGFLGRDDGDLGFYTYRDPQPNRSLEVMDRAADFVRDFCRDDPDLTGYILGAVSALDPLLTEETRRLAAENRYFKGTSYEDICRLYRELVGSTAKDLLALCPDLEELAAGQRNCVIAGKDLLDECGDKLENRITV